MTDPDGPAEETPRRYRNPPIEHRFRKGVSGNPMGRPRKTRPLVGAKIGGKPSVGFEDRVKSLAIEEAYRIIKIREGDRVEKVPVIQAILRKVAVAAANGNTRAQQTYLNLVIGAEADRRVGTMEVFETAVVYKDHWGRVLAERARSGATGPEPVPHPEDVIIDSETGEVRYDGPVNEEQRAAQKWLRDRWPELERGLMQINEQLESDPKNSDLRKQQRDLAKTVGWLRDDTLKCAMKRNMRDALRPTGRLTPDEKAEWDCIVKHRDTIQSTFDDFACRMERQPRDKILKKIVLHLREQFDLFNNRLPMRYQTTSSRRSRRCTHPMGLGLELNSARTASISLPSIAFPHRVKQLARPCHWRRFESTRAIAAAAIPRNRRERTDGVTRRESEDGQLREPRERLCDIDRRERVVPAFTFSANSGHSAVGR